jgi:hypothetical protein
MGETRKAYTVLVKIIPEMRPIGKAGRRESNIMKYISEKVVLIEVRCTRLRIS